MLSMVKYYFLMTRLWVNFYIEGTVNIMRRLVFGFPQATLPDNLRDKIVVITGANRGIGLETSKVFARLGATVIMACRDTKSANEALKQVQSELPEEERINVMVMQLDLASFASVQRFAAQVNQSVPHLDYLINNAGIMMCEEEKTVDGFELQLGINYLGHFLLTHLLLDKLRAATAARIVNLSSISHLGGMIHFKNINLTGTYEPLKAYAQSKLAIVLFTRELSKRLDNTRVTTYAVHPGLVQTDLYGLAQNLLVQLMTKLFMPISFVSVPDGTQTTLYCALDSQLASESGHYYKYCKRVDNMVSSVNDSDAHKLWQLSVQLCELNHKVDQQTEKTYLENV